MHSQARLADHLEIVCWHAVIGGSMGGMQALYWAIEYPERVANCVIIAATPSLSAQNIAFNYVAREIIKLDQARLGGGEQGYPYKGISIARMLGHLTYLSERGVHQRFGRKAQDQDYRSADDRFRQEEEENLSSVAPDIKLFGIESYLQHLGEKFAGSDPRFHPTSYIRMTQALDQFDPVRHRATSLSEVAASTRSRFLVVSFTSDWRFPPARSQELTSALVTAGRPVSYLNVESDKGHDSFLFPLPHYIEGVKAFLTSPGAFFHRSPHAAKRSRAPAGPLPRRLWGLFMIPWRLVKRGMASWMSAWVLDTSDAAWARRLTTWTPVDQSRIIDIGGGDCSLLSELEKLRGTSGYCTDVDSQVILNGLASGFSVLDLNFDEGFSLFVDDNFDIAILKDVLHLANNPSELLNEALRIAPTVVVIARNFGHIRKRLRFLFTGESYGIDKDRASRENGEIRSTFRPLTIADIDRLFKGSKGDLAKFSIQRQLISHPLARITGPLATLFSPWVMYKLTRNQNASKESTPDFQRSGDEAGERADEGR